MQYLGLLHADTEQTDPSEPIHPDLWSVIFFFFTKTLFKMMCTQFVLIFSIAFFFFSKTQSRENPFPLTLGHTLQRQNFVSFETETTVLAVKKKKKFCKTIKIYPIINSEPSILLSLKGKNQRAHH